MWLVAKCQLAKQQQQPARQAQAKAQQAEVKVQQLSTAAYQRQRAKQLANQLRAWEIDPDLIGKTQEHNDE